MQSSNHIEVMLRLVVQSLIDRPQDCRIEVIANGEATTTYRVMVHPTDTGKVIGKAGRTARSIRTIMQAAANRDQQRYALDILEIRG
jgi:hypothetical protein